MFRQLMSMNGSGALEPDANGGALRDVSPLVTAAASKALLPEDLARGVIFTTLSGCNYSLPGSEALLAAFPEWQIGASLSTLFARGAVATTQAIIPGGTRPMAAFATNGGTLLAMTRLVTIVRTGPLDFKFYCAGI
jgi:hypothetical protein